VSNLRGVLAQAAHVRSALGPGGRGSSCGRSAASLRSLGRPGAGRRRPDASSPAAPTHLHSRQ